MRTSDNTTIGFIGIGVMGKSMAGHLLDAGYKLHVYNRTKERADELDPGGVTSPSSAMVTPVFGGTGDDARDSSFYVGMDDIPGGPPDDIVQPDA